MLGAQIRYAGPAPYSSLRVSSITFERTTSSASCSTNRTETGKSEQTGQRTYLIESYTLNIGRYIAITMNPTMPPTTMIMIGSRMEVSALTAAATCSS
jgi:hypothetical protein